MTISQDRISGYIEHMKKDWSLDFAAIMDVDHREWDEEIVGMSCYTMLYQIADNFRGGEFRSEILKMYGIE